MRSKMRRAGFYYRTSDSKWVQRFRCDTCSKYSSAASFDLNYRYKKRRLHKKLVELLCSGVSQRRAARLLKINRKTVVRIFLLEAIRAEYLFRTRNFDRSKAATVEFDDLETFEHTKCKPLSITLAVEYKTRRILGLEVSSMAAKGTLVGRAKKLYGPRVDERKRGRRELFKRIAPHVKEDMLIKSDDNPYYPRDVRRHFPKARHVTYKGKRGAITGQGELKKVGFDPLFSLNHTCAMFRANVNRLFRKTWCTTKRSDRLYDIS